MMKPLSMEQAGRKSIEESEPVPVDERDFDT